MLNRYRLVAIALIAWTLFGTLIVALGAYFILSYGQMQTAIAVGACLGAVMGLVVGVIAASPNVLSELRGDRAATFRSVLLGSMVGAVVGVGALLVIGGFPTRSQADLSLIVLGPASLAIGSMLGLAIAIALQRRRNTK